ncbi:hypothetical protein BDN72DRAFT_865616 [Pluteus cervinus]|uniref:Uncharacterized protein n=1 Tax=Pluteus cervinus TaxID=181527 RepID=A0ACD3A0L3_9AGAR|nr:hypothetical protein BDN72DRAFT_865616 [Pluteus cervinus]
MPTTGQGSSPGSDEDGGTSRSSPSFDQDGLPLGSDGQKLTATEYLLETIQDSRLVAAEEKRVEKRKAEVGSGSEEGPKKKPKEVEDSEVKEATVYLQVHITEAPARRGAKTTTSTCESGPIFFKINKSYKSFLDCISEELPCPQENLQANKLQWQYLKLANDKKKPMTNSCGFDAMIWSLGKAKDRDIYIHMPPPTKPNVCCAIWHACRKSEPTCLAVLKNIRRISDKTKQI